MSSESITDTALVFDLRPWESFRASQTHIASTELEINTVSILIFNCAHLLTFQREFLNGQKYGAGVYTFADGTVVDSTWNNDKYK